MNDPKASSAEATGKSDKGLLRAWLAPWLELLQLRLQLLAMEAEEEASRLGAVLAWGALALLCLGLGLVFASVLLLVVFWEEHRVAVLLGLSLFFLSGGAIAWKLAQARIRQGSNLFSSSLAELSRDIQRLRE